MKKKNGSNKEHEKKLLCILLILVVYVALNIHQSNTLPSSPVCKQQDAELSEDNGVSLGPQDKGPWW